MTASSAGIIAFAAIEAEALGADIFAAQELSRTARRGSRRPGSPSCPRGLNRMVLSAPSMRSWRNRRSSTSTMCMIFQADLAAVIGLQNGDQFAHAGPLRAPDTPPRNTLRSSAAPEKPKIFRREISGQIALDQPQRIEIGSQMPAHAIGADQHASRGWCRSPPARSRLRPAERGQGRLPVSPPP